MPTQKHSFPDQSTPIPHLHCESTMRLGSPATEYQLDAFYTPYWLECPVCGFKQMVFWDNYEGNWK